MRMSLGSYFSLFFAIPCCFLLIITSAAASAQDTASPANSPETTVSPSRPISALDEQQVSWKQAAPRVLRDQVKIWTFPAEVAHGRHWKPALAFGAATAGLILLDPYDDRPFRNTARFTSFNRAFSSDHTAIATAVVPLSALAVGLARKNHYAQNTALLAGEAVAGSEILTLALKNVDNRIRPFGVASGGNLSDTWFEGHGPNRGSFPSGHSIAAFSVATVFAERYRRHRWVPWAAYGAAGLVGFSRVTLQAHFPADVFAGAVLGFSISRYVVLP
jgi:membrane-associated phospholipid phosphatase